MRIARIAFVGWLLSWCVHATLSAQYHDPTYVAGSTALERVTGSGSVQVLFDNPGATHGLAMDVDNRTIVFGDGSAAFAMNAIARLDPATNVVTTIRSDPRLLYGPLDLVVNQDGDYVFTNRYQRFVTPTFAIFDVGLFKLTRTTGTISTIATTVQTGTAQNWAGGLAIDIDTGDYVVQDRSLANDAPLLRVTESGAVSTIGSGFSPSYAITQDLRTGDWYSAAGNDIHVLKSGMTTPTSLFGVLPTASFTVIAFDRASAANRRIVSVAPGAVYSIDVAAATVATVGLSARASNPWDMTFWRGRNLCSVKTGVGRWDLRLSFPGEGGKAYAIAASTSGVRPGVPLVDGRVIPLQPDGITFLTLANLVPSVWNPGPLALDPSGEARATLDVSTLGLGGATLWIVAAVIDGGNLGTIADPIVIRL